MSRPDRGIPRPFRFLLRLLPRSVREAHEREMEAFLREEMPADRFGRVRYWFQTLADMLRASPGAHADILRQDLSLSIRQLRRAPGYAALAILTLAIGIGGNAALFTVVDDALLEAPPFMGVDRLIRVNEENVERGLLDFGISPGNFRDFADAPGDLVEAAAAWQPRSGTVRLDGTPERVTFAAVSGEFFRVFLETPAVGRALGPDDDVPGAAVAVLGHAFWRTRMGGDEAVVGRTLELNGTPHRILGVMPEGFSYPGASVAIWTPLGLPPDEWERRGPRYLGATLRMASGADLGAVAARIEARAAALAERAPESNDGWSASVRTLAEAASAGVRSPLLMVWFGAGLVLLIAVANVANLLVGRAVSRQEEMALRRALGARAGRLFRQTLTEGSVLAFLGAAAGLGLAAVLLGALRANGADLLPRSAALTLDVRTILFTVVLTALVTLAFSMAPTLAGRDMGSATALRRSRSGRSRGRARLQTGLVTGQIALAVVVAIGTGLLARSAVRLLAQPLGYAPEGVMTFRVEPPVQIEDGLPFEEAMRQRRLDRQRAAERYRALVERIEAEPGVAAASAISRLPLTGEWWVTGVRLPESATPDEDHAAYIRIVLPGYMEAMGTRVIEGRDLDEGDVAGGDLAVVVDETFAARFWPGESAVGRTVGIYVGRDETRPARVVGVVETIRQSSLEAEPRPTFYMRLAQAFEGHFGDWGMDVVVRTAGAPISESVLKDIAGDYLPNAAVFRVLSMEDLVSESVASRRFQLGLFGAFAGVALVLTLVGVFGVLALYVRERNREFGVRLALGASPRHIRWMVQRNALRCATWGSAIGLAAAALTAGLFSSLVYGISTFDPIAFVGGPIALGLAALAGGLIPALTATRTDPATVLRSD